LLLLIAPSLDVLAGRLVIAAWFFVFAMVMMLSGRSAQPPARKFLTFCAAASIAMGLPLAVLLPSSAYAFKFVLMVSLSACVMTIGLRYGPRRYIRLGLVAVVLAYVAVAFQYVLTETAR